MIWDSKNGAYWRPNGGGYTQDVLLAGAYTREQAEEIKRRLADRIIDIIPADKRAAEVYSGRLAGSVAEHLGWFSDLAL